MKKLPVLLVLSVFLLICSCGESRIIFPFEADIEKHFTAYEKDFYKEAPDSGVILDNGSFSVGINERNDALWFHSAKTGEYFDLDGNLLLSPDEAEPCLCIKRDGEDRVRYKKTEYYDVVFNRYLPTLTTFFISENTVRVIYIIGGDQLDFLGTTPAVITEKTYFSNVFAFGDIYSPADSESEGRSVGFMSEYCTAKKWYALTADFHAGIASYTETDHNTVRSELLNLGYDPQLAEITLFVADISLSEDGITVDVSPNRQYRTAALRTSRYFFDPVGNDIPFVTKTFSESERIFYAGSQY